VSPLLWLVLGASVAFFLMWTDGSNNAADMIGTAVGAKLVPLRKALVIAAVSDFTGALLFGPYISKTMMRGIANTVLITSPKVIIAGMIAALLATAVMELISSIAKVPMPVTVGIVISLMTFGLISLGGEGVEWGSLTRIFISWIILPFFSAGLALILLKTYGRMFYSSRRLPIVAGSSALILVSSAAFLLLYKASRLGGLAASATYSLLLGSVFGFLLWWYSKRVIIRKRGMEEVIRVLMIIAMASVAFSHGANDVGKAAGPLTAISIFLSSGNLEGNVGVMFSALLISALGIATGIITWGHRVVGTIGEEITTLTYTSAFTAQLSCALSVLIMTRLGIPVSTTQAIVGSVAGVGLASGYRTVNLRTVSKIFVTWGVAIPISAGLTALLYYGLMLL